MALQLEISEEGDSITISDELDNLLDMVADVLLTHFGGDFGGMNMRRGWMLFRSI